MKELSIEEKAKAYDEALEKLRDFYRDYDTVSCLIDVKEELANLFPELKESEDEKTRKEIVGYLKRNLRLEWAAWLEKQGEQNLADEVKPKFHKGDWITNGACIIQITSVDDTYYWHDNDCVGGDIESIDKQYHLWTIQDAKEGDVICYETKNDFKIFIYKNGHINYHCCYNNGHLTTVDSFFAIQKHLLCYIHPATKEQCGLLFAKMKEAGYEWSDKDRKLIKIVK